MVCSSRLNNSANALFSKTNHTFAYLSNVYLSSATLNSILQFVGFKNKHLLRLWGLKNLVRESLLFNSIPQAWYIFEKLVNLVDNRWSHCSVINENLFRVLFEEKHLAKGINHRIGRTTSLKQVASSNISLFSSTDRSDSGPFPSLLGWKKLL